MFSLGDVLGELERIVLFDLSNSVALGFWNGTVEWFSDTTNL